LHLVGVDTTIWSDNAGAGGEVWSTAGNWDNGLPGATVAAVVDSSANNTATLSGAAAAHTLIVEGASATIGATGVLTVANNTHVMDGAALEVAGELHSNGDTTVYDGGSLDVQGGLVLSDEKNLTAAGGTTTFGAASSLSLNVIGGLPEDVKGNLNVAGGVTTIADGASIAVNAINATGGVLNIEADLNPNATPLSIDGAVVNSAALKAAAVNLTGGSLTSAGATSAAALSISGGQMTTAGAAASGMLHVSGSGLLSTSADLTGGTVELVGGTITKTGAGAATISQAGGADIDTARGTNLRIDEGSLVVNLAPAPIASTDPVHVLLVTANDPPTQPVEIFIKDRLEARPGFTVETRQQDLDPPNSSVPGETAFDVSVYQLVIPTFAVYTPNASKYGGTNVPMVTSSWDAYTPGHLGWTETSGTGVAGTTLDMVSPTHHPAGGRLSGTESVYASDDPRARAGGRA